MEPKDLIQSLKNNMTTALTSDPCHKHEKDERGIIVRTKPVFKLLIDGEYICPICERDKKNDELSERESKKLKGILDKREYNLLHQKSILKDKSLFLASFLTYEANESEEIKNKDRATKAFREYKKNRVFNTFFQGLPGVGKSHLAMSILRNVNEAGEKNKQCLFIEVDEMLRLIRDSFNDKESIYTEKYFIDLLSKVDLLVLDDLGAETGNIDTSKEASDFTGRILKAVSGSRQDKSTIITTNLSRPQLELMYDKKLVSRILKDTFLIKFEETSDKRIRNIEF